MTTDGRGADVPQRASKPRLASAQRRASLLDAAIDIIREGHLADVTIERVARRVGVHKRVVYRFFGNSDELLLAVLDRENAVARELVMARLATADTLEAKFRCFVVSYLEVYADDQLRLPGFATASKGGVLAEARKRRAREVIDFIASLILAEVDVDRAIASTGATIFMYGLDGLVDLHSDGLDVAGADAQRLEDDFIAVAMAAIDGLERRSPAPPPM